MKIFAVVFLLCLVFVDSKKGKDTVLIYESSGMEYMGYAIMINRTCVLQFSSLMKSPEANLLA